ncbi:hypothetical protein CR513_30510, partial [Mucuna pruriens]
MNQLIEKFCNFSLAQRCFEDIGNFISYVISTYGVNAMTAITCVILGCPFLIYVLTKRRPKPEDKAEPKQKPIRLLRTRSFIIREIHSGNAALDRLLEDDYKQARVNPSALDKTDTLLKEHLQQELPNLMILQQNVAKLEMSGKEDDAEKIIRQALKKANEKKRPQEAYEIEMLLVEVLIYKGGDLDLESALKCKCLKDESLRDVRRPLYKAIIYKMKGDTKEAEKCWDEFIQVRDPALSRPEIQFEIFEHHVERLQNAIQDVTARKRNMFGALFLS